MPKGFDRKKHLLKIGRNTRFRKNRIERNCEYCGEIYSRIPSDIGRFCSLKCSNIARGPELGEKRKGPRRQICLYCDYCGKEFYVPICRKENGQKYCSKKCRTDASRKLKASKERLKKWAKQVKLRDQFVCMECGENDRDLLHAHHIKFKNNYPDLYYEIDNGITLCVCCHADKHEKKLKGLILWHLLRSRSA